MKTVRLTMAQALVRYLINQKTEIDGETVPLFPGVFAIFGHGNVTCISEALEPVQDVLPTWRGQNEQSMALAKPIAASAIDCSFCPRQVGRTSCTGSSASEMQVTLPWPKMANTPGKSGTLSPSTVVNWLQR